MSGWNDPDSAPYDTIVRVRTFNGNRFKAQLLRDASMTDDEKPCDQWQAVEGERHPRDWCGGACWESNSNGLASDPVMGWQPLSEGKAK